MERQDEWAAKRKRVAVVGSAIIGIVGAVGIAIGFSLFLKCYDDYPKVLQYILAFFTAGAIEGTLCWFTYNLLHSAATFGERAVAVGSIALLLAVVAVNMSTHQALVNKASLAKWQLLYINYVGPAVLVAILVMVILQLYMRHENAEAFRERSRTIRVKDRVANLEQELLDSDEFEDHFKKHYKQVVFDKATRRLGLPSAPGRRDYVDGELIESKKLPSIGYNQPQLAERKATEKSEAPKTKTDWI
jgi:hypothetical protein